VAGQGADLAAGGNIPQLRGVVVAAGGERLAVAAPDHGRDVIRVPLEGGEFLPGGGVPELDGPVGAGSRQGLAVGRERDAADPPGVAREGARLPGRFDCPGEPGV
jgi:hypothetical protein